MSSSAEHAEAGPAAQEMPDLRQQRRRQAAAWCGEFGHLDSARFTRQTSNALRADMLSKRDHPPPRAQVSLSGIAVCGTHYTMAAGSRAWQGLLSFS